MKIIGLTGASGAGKTLAAEYFSQCGFSVVDADAVYHDLCKTNRNMLEELVEKFGGGVECENGVDRSALAGIVFSSENREKLNILNEITHKYILAAIEQKIKISDAMGVRALVIDAPLLFESGLDKRCDATVGVIAPDDVRTARITERDGITAGDAALRMGAGQCDDFYAERCDFIIFNSGDKNQVLLTVNEIAEKIFEGGKGE